MIRPVRMLAMFAALGMLLAAPAARAQFPPNVLVTPGHINLVGRDPSLPTDQADVGAPYSTLTVLVRTIAGDPVPGKQVVVDFSGCASDVRIASLQSYHNIGVFCGYSAVASYSASDGSCTFVVIGGSTGGTSHAARCARVYVDGYMARQISVGTYDQDDANGVKGDDLALFGQDLLGGLSPSRSDYDGNGLVNGADLSIFGGVLLGGHSTASGVALCP